MSAMNWSALAIILCADAGSLQDPPASFGVEGTILDTTGSAVSNAEVRLILDSPKGGKLADTSHTDSKGRFSTSGWIVSILDGDGDWRLEATAPGYAPSVVDELFLGFGVYDVGPIYLFRPVPITGRVTDERGSPIAGAEIHAAPGEAGWSRQDYARSGPVAITGADGTYLLHAFPPGVSTLGVSAPDYADAVARRIVLNADRPNSLDFVLAREDLCEGRVVDKGGKPIVAARIEMLSPGFWRNGVESGVDGRFVIHGLEKGWTGLCRIHAPGFLPERMPTGLPLDSRPVVLARSGTLLVQAEQEGSDLPPKIESVRIRNGCPMDSGGCGMGEELHWAEVRSDSDFVEVIEPSKWRVYWEAALHAEAHDCESHAGLPKAIGVNLEDGSLVWADASDPRWRRDFMEVKVHAPRSGRIAGRVLRIDNDRPVAGTTVMTNRWSVIKPDLIATTDAEGRFVFEAIAEGDLHDLTVDNEHWRGEAPEIVVRAGRTTECVLRVAPPPRIRGQITIKGRPPRRSMVIGLGEFQRGEVVGGGWFGLGVSDAEGHYSVIPHYDRESTVVPKKRATPQDGGYRRFRSEFPGTKQGSWPWIVQAPGYGEVRLDLDLPE